MRLCSYTKFSIEFAQTPAADQPIAPGEETEWIVTLKNVGEVAGGVVVTCYVSAVDVEWSSTAENAPPKRSLFDFARVEGLAAGASTMIPFALTPRGRGLVDAQGLWTNPAGTYSVVCEAGGVAKTAAAGLRVG